MTAITDVVGRIQGAGFADKCMVSFVYVDAMTCNPLLFLKHCMESKLSNDIGFSFNWWRIKYLRESLIASLAAQCLAASDVILFSLHALLDVPRELVAFNQIWLKERKSGQGGLLGLVQCHPGSERSSSPASELYLKSITETAQMDFVTCQHQLKADNSNSTQASRIPIVEEEKRFTQKQCFKISGRQIIGD